MSDAFEARGELPPAISPEQQQAPAAPVDASAFAALGLAKELVSAVADMGYSQPTAVQLRVMPLALKAEGAERFADLMVSSQTGSGKTAAFLLPVLHTLIQQQAARAEAERLERDRLTAEAAERGDTAPKGAKRKNPMLPRHFKAATPGALVLCPTRELAQQVAHDAIGLVSHCRGLRIASVVGGMPYQLQIAKLQNADLVVATPGRLLDLQRSMQIKLDEVQFLVVDEADRMLDLGFSDDLAEINALTAQRRQTMMFSATFAPRIQQLAMRVMHDNGKHAQKIQIDSPQAQHANIKQTLYWADSADHKRKLLDHWLRDASINQAIVFASTQIECDGLATELQQAGFAAVALHGALSQGLRNRRLMALRNGQVQILVATDVAARGIDVPTITHVFNFGLPMKAEDYTHRIGRTGRAGRDGLAVTFAEFRDRRRISDIEAYTQQRFKPEVVVGLEPRQRAPEPERAGRGRPSSFAGRGNDRFGGDRRGPPPARAPRFEGRDGGAPRFGDGGAPRFDNRDGGAPRFDNRGGNDRFGGAPRADQAPRQDQRFDPRFEGRPAPTRGDFAERGAPRAGGFGSDRPARAGARPGGFGGDRPSFNDRGPRRPR